MEVKNTREFLLRNRAGHAAGWTKMVAEVVIVIYSESDDKMLVALMVVFEGLQVLTERGLEVLCSSPDEASSGRERDRKSTRLNSSHQRRSRMPSSA